MRRRRSNKKSPGRKTTVVQGKTQSCLSNTWIISPTDTCTHHIETLSHTSVHFIFSVDVFTVTTPVITPTGQPTQGSTLSRLRRVWEWKRKAAAQRKKERRRGTGRRIERRTRSTKTTKYQRRSSQRRRGRLVNSYNHYSLLVAYSELLFFKLCLVGFAIAYNCYIRTNM